MLRAYKTTIEKTNMEQIRPTIRKPRNTTMRKMRGMHKPENTRMDIQTR